MQFQRVTVDEVLNSMSTNPPISKQERMNLKELYDQAKKYSFETCTIKHIPRNSNKHADSLVNKELDLQELNLEKLNLSS
jgi:hypothetical protein